MKNRAVVCAVGLAMAFLAGCTPPGPRALLDGKRLLEEGKPEAAVARLEIATDLLKTNALAWSYLGLACQEAGRTAQATNAYQRALMYDRNLIEVRYNLGCLLLDLGRAEAARSELTAYTMRQPRAIDGWLKLGAAQLRLRETVNAEKSFAEALKLNSNSPVAWNGLGMAQMQRNRPRDAAQDFSNALRRPPSYPPALRNLAIVAQQTGNRALALGKYREYAALQPRPADADAALALARQLELEIAPPPPRSVPTNAVAHTILATNPPRPVVVATNVPKPAGSNTAIAAVPRPVAPATNQVQVRPAATNPAPASQPKPTVEVVTLPDAPVLKVAQDAPPPGTSTSPPPPEPVPTVAAPIETTTAPAKPQAKTEKRSLLSRLNPVGWFGGSPKPSPAPTPLPASGSVTNSDPTAVLASRPKPAKSSASKPPATFLSDSASAGPEVSPPPRVTAPAPVRELPVVPRYTYRSPARPVPGDRKAAEPAFLQGVKEQQLKRLSEAMQDYKLATQSDPAYFEAFYNWALAAHQARQYPVALTASEMALAIDPESADARYNFALALRDAGYWLDAAAELEKLLASRPNETRAHFALGNLYAQKLQQPQKARPHYLKLLEAEPNHPQASSIRYWVAMNPG